MCLKDIPELMVQMRPRGRITEEEFEARDIKHLLSQAWAVQHHRQRATILTTSQLVEYFAAANKNELLLEIVRENICANKAEETQWCHQIRSDNN